RNDSSYRRSCCACGVDVRRCELPTGDECATVLTAEKVRCSPSSPCSRASALCAWLRVAPRLPSPSLRAVAWALPGRDGKAGSPIEPESWICEVAARTTASRSGLRVTTPTGVQLRVGPLQRRGLRSRASWLRWTPLAGQESGQTKRESRRVSNAPPDPRGLVQLS